MMITQAFILAAGLGLRMRPITDKIPKPMVEIHGKSIITRIIDDLIVYSIKHIVINAAYKADQLITHVMDHMNNIGNPIAISFSKEEEPLETGGGIIKAMHLLKKEPFFVINSDSLFLSKENVFTFMNRHWNTNMDALLLLCEKANSLGYDGAGDFDLDSKNHLSADLKTYIYTGIHIAKRKFFEDLQLQKISCMKIYEELQFRNMNGIKFPGTWLHIGTPEMIDIASKELGGFHLNP